jgi:hypothetical protein
MFVAYSSQVTLYTNSGSLELIMMSNQTLKNNVWIACYFKVLKKLMVRMSTVIPSLQ